MARHATTVLASAAVIGIALASGACNQDVVGGSRDVDADEGCPCDCELGCPPGGPDRPDASAQAAAQGTGSGEAVAAGAGGADPTGGAGGAGGQGGQGGGGGAGGDDCAEDASVVEVTIDGEEHATCAVEATLGALSHATATLGDGHTLILSWNGGGTSDDACVGIALRAPGNDTAENDWQAGDGCELAITEHGARVVGSFEATLDPVSDLELGSRELTAGSLDLAAR